MKKPLQEQIQRIKQLSERVGGDNWRIPQTTGGFGDERDDEGIIDAITEYVDTQQQNGKSLDDIEKTLIDFVRQNIDAERGGDGNPNLELDNPRANFDDNMGNPIDQIDDFLK